MNSFSPYAVQLYNKGYSPIPIRPSSKVPFLKKGESWKVEVTEATIEKWSNSTAGTGGIGIKGICAVDFDIMNNDAVMEMKEYLKEYIESPVLFRTGKPPKFLMPVHTDSAINKKMSNVWYDSDGKRQMIEYLSAADQYFVAFGIHPETHKQYYWENNDSIMDVFSTKLPVLTDLCIAGIEDAFDTIASKMHWSKKIVEKNNINAGSLNTSELLAGIKKGNRDNFLFKYGCRLREKNIYYEEAKIILLGIAEKCDPPFNEKEVIRKLEQAWKYNPGSSEENNTDEFNEVVSSMNEKHAVINISGKCKILNESKNDLTFSSISDFNALYSNRYLLDSSKKKKKLSKIWLDSEDRRQYDGIVFEPGEDKSSKYNLWKGFSTNPESGDWSFFKGHIYNVISDHNKEIGDWIIAWFARLVQNPGGNRPGTSLVLRGKQGTGKGLFVNLMGSLFGNHYIQVAHSSHIIGKFNYHLKDKVLVFVDEGFWAGDRRAEGIIKNLVTEPWLAIEPKGLDVIRVRNHINLVMASNSSWVVPAALEERRFFVIDINSERQRDHKYFKALIHQMNNGGKEAMLYDLMHYDYSKTDLHNFVQTQGLFEQKLHTMTTIQKYWFERIRSGGLVSSRCDSNPFSLWGKVEADTQYKDYLIFAEDLKEKFPLSPTQFGMALKRMCPRCLRKKVRKGVELFWIRRFPPLEDCRKLFEKEIRMDFEWTETIDENI